MRARSLAVGLPRIGDGGMSGGRSSVGESARSISIGIAGHLFVTADREAPAAVRSRGRPAGLRAQQDAEAGAPRRFSVLGALAF